MKLIVGLGNPGLLYKNTRHNVGFCVIEQFCKKNNIKIKDRKFNGNYAIANINGQKVIILKPLKYINLSGEVINKYVDYYKINVDDILIVHDDMDIEIGNYKLKSSGSSAGHNGLKNIEQNLKTQEYKRLKIGISKTKSIEKKDYVLGKFDLNEKEIVNDIIEISTNILLDFIKMDFVNLMNKYNKKN